ncbi:hypothetical protein ACFVS9_15125 [Streptomyces sp. NPDC058008]|uniref:hypothetical protein n=1 Tax=Streptomyces sp. NPDC058008 TaxID=3346303 RepID=UPI0036E497A3
MQARPRGLAPGLGGHFFGSSGSVPVTVGSPAGSHVQVETAGSEIREVGCPDLDGVSFPARDRRIRIDDAARVVPPRSGEPPDSAFA